VLEAVQAIALPFELTKDILSIYFASYQSADWSA